MHINKLQEIIKNGGARLVSIFNRDSVLYLIEILDSHKLYGFKINDNDPVLYKVSSIEELMKFVIDSSASITSYEKDNYKLVDDEVSSSATLGLEILNTIMASTHADISEEYVIDVSQFFDEATAFTYNYLIKNSIFSVEQIIDLELKIDKSKTYIPKFYTYYKRFIYKDGHDNNYQTLTDGTVDRFGRAPKDFTLISNILLDNYSADYLEFVLEVYTKIKYLNLMKYKFDRCKKEIEFIEPIYKKFI